MPEIVRSLFETHTVCPIDQFTTEQDTSQRKSKKETDRDRDRENEREKEMRMLTKKASGNLRKR